MKRSRLYVWIVLLVIVSVCITGIEPPVREELNDNPNQYSIMNHYVRKQREQFIKEGRITEGFLPLQIDTEQLLIQHSVWENQILYKTIESLSPKKH